MEGVVYLQHIIREKDGWLRMMAALLSTGWSIEVPLVSPLPITQEHYIGAWINGLDERVARWLLYVGVPCFIIHEYRGGLDFGPGISDRHSIHAMQSFCHEVWHLLPAINAYENVALRHSTSWSKTPPLPRCSNVIVSADVLDLSSSYSQGYIHPESDIYRPPEPEDGDITWPSVCLYKDRIPWLKPPPIIVAKKEGAWSQFCITSLDVEEGHSLHDHEVMQERGKTFKGEGLSKYYDRANKCQLYFNLLPCMLAGLISASAFGLPVPFHHFVSLDIHGRLPKTVCRSTWMYATADPKPADVGRNPPTPAATDLEAYSRVPPTDSYLAEDFNDNDDDDDYYGRYHIPQPAPPPPSPPASDNMEPLDSIPDFDQDILSVLISYQQYLHALLSSPAPAAPAG